MIDKPCGNWQPPRPPLDAGVPERARYEFCPPPERNESMSTATILIPQFVLVLIGLLLRRHSVLSQAFWSDLERLIYYVLFPALLFGATATNRFELLTAASLIGTGALAMGSGMLLAGLGRLLFRPAPVSYASAFQCTFRFNSYLGFAVLGGLHGQAGIAAFGLLAGFMVPLANFAAVWALARHNRSNLLREVAGNPLVISTLAGISWSLLDLPLPQAAADSLQFLGGAALPMGLMAVGAGLRGSALAGKTGFVVYLTAVKLLAVPAVAYVVAHLLGVEGIYYAAVLVLAALPTASSAYILAVRMRGDGELVASITLVNMIGAIATLPLWLAVLGGD